MNRIAFVGFSPHDQVPDDLEVWTLNHAYRFDTRIDRLFEMHPKGDIEQRNFYNTDEEQKAHISFLKADHDFPIYMIEKYEEFPASVKYPLMDTRKRFSSSFCYLAALAVLEMPRSVDIYGFDMDELEYKHQRPDALYWIGRMEGKGIAVNVHGKLLPDIKLYGYERINVVNLHSMTVNRNRYKKQYDNNIANMHKWEGAFIASAGRKKQEAAEQARMYELNAAMAQGAIEAIDHLIAQCNLEE